MNYRINSNILLQIVSSPSFEIFKEYSQTIDNKNYVQAVEETTQLSFENQVWNFGEFAGRINKVFNSDVLIELSSLVNANKRKQECSLLLRQGFSWDNIIGILVVIKGMNTGYIYTSRLLTINDFVINAEISRELIENAFWTSEKIFNIPDLVNNENLMVSIESIPYSDVVSEGNTIGLITTYPASDFNFEPLIAESVLPSYIDVALNISETLFLNIQPVTLELNKTLERSLLDYFGLTKNIVPITISHVVKYGNDTDGFKTIRVSNEDSVYNSVTVGLDFRQLTNTNCLVFVSTEFKVNDILMKREHSLIFDYGSILNPILNDVLVKDNDISVFPVTVTNETVINQNVIQQETEQKIVTITQPVYVEMVQENILFENKNIAFNNITEQSFMEIADKKSGELQYVQAKLTVDNKYYFPLHTVAKPEKDSTFNIISAISNIIIGKGTFTN